MPVYAYKCKDCNHQFDLRQSFSDPAVKVCPECGGEVRKQFNSVGVVFKGSGFYRNDSRNSGSKASNTSGGTNQSDSSGGKDSGSTTGETKSAGSSDSSAAGHSTSPSDSGPTTTSASVGKAKGSLSPARESAGS